jgi:hypothetical protein
MLSPLMYHVVSLSSLSSLIRFAKSVAMASAKRFWTPENPQSKSWLRLITSCASCFVVEAIDCRNNPKTISEHSM